MQTNSPSDERTRFVFRELVVNQALVHQERATGYHDGDRLVLGEVEIPDHGISGAAFDNDRIQIRYVDQESKSNLVEFTVLRDPVPVWHAINYGLSRRTFASQLDQAASRGEMHLVRETVCPWCQAKSMTLESGAWTPQVWCQYCDSLITTTLVEGLGNSERNYRLCPECGMYSRPRKFSEAYFYFLVVHAGVHHKEMYCCSGCMRPRVWRMMLGNLPGVLGMPLAATQWFRVYGDSAGRGPLRGLDSANRLLRKKRIKRALGRYSKILERHPVSAGVLYNVALGLIAAGDHDSARQTLELALENCGNYRPAQLQLARLNQSLEV